MELTTTKNIKDLTKEQIIWLQQRLSVWGYSLKDDGILGKNTIKAFNQFSDDYYFGYPNLIGETKFNKLIQNPPTQKINRAGLNLIKEFEGFRAVAYLCPAQVWTIGYGSTYYPDRTKVKQGDRISTKEGEELLKVTVRDFENAINQYVRVPLTPNQFSALVSFAFNVGVSAFRDSTLLRKLNQKEYNEVHHQLMRWTRANKRILQGLVRRRLAESELFYK